MLKPKQLPPQHRADAPIVFVHHDDSAWDMERVRAEQAEIRDTNGDPTQHPVARYLGGYTRYDLDAPGQVLGRPTTAREYIDENKQPTRWTLRRLSWREWYEVQPLFERAAIAKERPRAAYATACQMGVVKVEAGPTLEFVGGRLTNSDMQRLYEIDQELPYDLGAAVYAASLPLSESEGKH